MNVALRRSSVIPVCGIQRLPSSAQAKACGSHQIIYACKSGPLPYGCGSVYSTAQEQWHTATRVRSSIFPAYILLETVLATGVLLVGLAVIGAQLQGAQKSVHLMDRQMRAMSLAEVQLAYLDLGLIELDTLDEVQEEDFGPQYPDWGWRLTIQETAIEEMFLLRLDVLFSARSAYFQKFGTENAEEFDFDNAEVVHTLYALRATPRPMDLTTELGLTDEQADELCLKLSEIGAEGFDCTSFDLAFNGKLPFEDLVTVLPLLMNSFGIPVDAVLSSLPPDVRDLLNQSGILEGLGKEGEAAGENGGASLNGGENEGEPDS